MAEWWTILSMAAAVAIGLARESRARQDQLPELAERPRVVLPAARETERVRVVLLEYLAAAPRASGGHDAPPGASAHTMALAVLQSSQPQRSDTLANRFASLCELVRFHVISFLKFRAPYTASMSCLR